MARTVIDLDGDPQTVNLDDRRRRGLVRQSIMLVQLADELSGRAISGRIRITSSIVGPTTGVRPKAGPFGVCGLVGEPARVFPRLDLQPYSIDAAIAVDGFVPLDVTASVAQQAGFPDTFVGADLGTLELRRTPVSLIVRTTQLDAQDRSVAVPSSVVSLTGVWRTFAALTGAASPPNLIAVAPPVSADRAIAAVVARVTINPIAEPPRTIITSLAPGDTDVHVSRTGSVVVGDVIGFEHGDAERAEHIEVASVTGPTDPESPSTLGLRFPVQVRHRVGASATRMAVAALGPPTATLTDTTRPGDVTVFVNTVAPFAAAPFVSISGGGATAEFHTARPYAITTDADGYGRFPPLGRVAAFEMHAQSGALVAGPLRYTPDHRAAENAVPLTMS